jgi:hypothetical protein
VSYIETSAINGTNVEEAFAVLSKKIIDKIDKGCRRLIAIRLPRWRDTETQVHAGFSNFEGHAGQGRRIMRLLKYVFIFFLCFVSDQVFVVWYQFSNVKLNSLLFLAHAKVSQQCRTRSQ